ncbi:MAG: hypothetical protein ACP5N0_02570 [Methanosarcina sp.]
MKTKLKALSSIFRFTVVLIVLCIVPSGAFASENNPIFAPAQNITEENFTEIQGDMLDSISEQIAELQSFYTNVSEASNASELQEILSIHLPLIKYASDGMNKEPCGISGFDLFQVENVTDYNYTDFQLKIVDYLGNMTEMLKAEQTNIAEAGDDERAKEIGETIADLEYLSTNVNATSDAAEMQKVILTYMKTQADKSLEKEIEHLEDNVSDIENTTDDINGNITELNDRISELTAQREKINGAEFLEDLKSIMPSSQAMPGMDFWNLMRCGGCNCPLYHPEKTQENNTDNSTKSLSEK